MRAQFEIRIIDSLKAGLSFAAVGVSIKVVCFEGARVLANYSMGLAVAWGVLLLFATIFAFFQFVESVSSDPMLFTITPNCLMILNLKNNRELQVVFKQIVSYRFLEHIIREELQLTLENGRVLSLTAYNFTVGGKDFCRMVNEFEAAVSRYNQQPDGIYIIKREAPFIQ